MKLYHIDCWPFASITATDLTPKQIRKIASIKPKIGRDEYSGYSPEQQKIYRSILKVCENNLAEVIEL